MLTNALTWGRLRELWMDIYEYHEATDLDLDVKRHLYMALKAVAPIHISDPKDGGDSGCVSFKDHSEIEYDWDNGAFECENVRFRYPYGWDDPLYFDYTSDIGWYINLMREDCETC